MTFAIERVRARMPGRRIDYYDSVPSTMPLASGLAAQGCSSGTAVVAGEQTAGVGRHGHQWHSEYGTGLYASVVLRLAAGGPVLTLALGLATAEAIAQTTGAACDLRWPNDVMCGGRKVAGILVQTQDAREVFIAGIGINVNQASFPAELASEATSLRIETGRTHRREEILAALLDAIDSHAALGREEILRSFSEASSYARRKRVRVNQGGTVLEGTTAGLDPSGFLIVEKDDGARELVLAGGVRPL